MRGGVRTQPFTEVPKPRLLAGARLPSAHRGTIPAAKARYQARRRDRAIVAGGRRRKNRMSHHPAETQSGPLPSAQSPPPAGAASSPGQSVGGRRAKEIIAGRERPEPII